MNNIDQMDRFAPAFACNLTAEGKTFAFIATHHEHEGPSGPGLGIAVAGEQGYYPVAKFYYSTGEHSEAEDRADQLNREVLNLKNDTVARIVCSTMGGMSVA